MPLRLLALIATALALALLIAAVRARPRDTHTGTPVAKVDPALRAEEPARDTRHPLPRLAPLAAPPATDLLAHIHGRVILPPEISETPEVEAADGERRMVADVQSDGTFDLRLAPARLTLTARVGELVGVVEGVEATAGADREVTIALVPAASIAGSVRWHGEHISARVVASATGRPDSSDETNTQDRFEVSGLFPGVRYQLTVEADEARTVTLSVLAPASGIEIVLEPAPILRGAIGPDRRGGCPVDEIELKADGASDAESYRIDRRCHFEVPLAFPSGTRLRVEARSPGWHLTAAIDVPAHGDPPELCLNPPCRPVTVERAEVEVVVEGGHLEPMGARIDGAGWRGTGRCTGDGACVVEDLPVGQSLRVRAHARACGLLEPQQILTRARERMRVTFPCRRLRDVIGIVRGGTPNLQVFVRCGDHQQVITGRRTFTLLCPTDVPHLEYRPATELTWRSVLLPGGPVDDTALVEVELP